MAKRKSRATERFLEFLEQVTPRDLEYTSRQRGKSFFYIPGIGNEIQILMSETELSTAQISEACNMSVETLNEIVASDRASDSMLFRLAVGVRHAVKGSKNESAHDWVVLGDKLEAKVDNVINSLRMLHRFLEERNSLDTDDGPISPIERAQLIAVLQAMLIELNAPAVSRSRLQLISQWLVSIVRRTAEKGIETGLTSLATDARSTISELLKHLAKRTGIDFFG